MAKEPFSKFPEYSLSKNYEFRARFGVDVHLAPGDDIVTHVESISCVCDPELVYYDNERFSRVYQHRNVKESLQ